MIKEKDTLVEFTEADLAILKHLPEVLWRDVSKIGEYGFHSCPGLKRLTIPEGVKEIGAHAFYFLTPRAFFSHQEKYTIEDFKENEYLGGENTTFQSLTLPASLTSIGTHAFPPNAYSFKELNYNGTLAQWCNIKFEDCLGNPIACAKRINIKDRPVEGALILPQGIKKVGDCTFCNLKSITSIIVPEGVTSIGKQAFYACTYVTEVTLPQSLTEIGEQAFAHLKNVRSLTLPDNLQTIGKEAFRSWRTLRRVKFGKNLKVLGESCFSTCKELSHVDLPYGLTTIGDCAFEGCTKLKRLRVPSTVTYLGSYVAYHEITLEFELRNGKTITLSAKEYREKFFGDISKVRAFYDSPAPSLVSRMTRVTFRPENVTTGNQNNRQNNQNRYKPNNNYRNNPHKHY